MKQKRFDLILAVVLILLTGIAAVIHLSTRTSVPEGSLHVEYRGSVEEVALDSLAKSDVQGTVVNGKGEIRTIQGQGVLVSILLEKMNITVFEEVTAIAADEYSAAVTDNEIEEPAKVYLMLQEEGGAQLVVFGDENSKRNVEDVIQLVVS